MDMWNAPTVKTAFDIHINGKRGPGRPKMTWKQLTERDRNGAVKTAFDIHVNGKRGPGRPKMTWKQLGERDRREWKLSATLMIEIPGDLV